MAGPGGKSAGRLSIRVVPDSSKFRDDLKVMLERAERTMRVNLQVVADTRSADSAMRKFRRDWDGKDFKLNADVATLGAATHLKTLTRPRIVEILPTVSKAAAAKVGSILSSLSGLSNLQQLGKRVDSFFTDIGKDLPKIALMATSIGGLGASALNAVHGLGGVVVGLSQLVPLTALLPGLLLGTAVGVTTLVFAFKNAPKSIHSALSAYKSLQGIIAGNFWNEAATPIRGFLKGILPQLKTGFAGTADAIGSALGGIASTLNTAFSGGVLASIFQDLQAGVVAALPGLNSFSTAFVSLLSVGAAFLPQFGGFISKIGADFSAWVTGAEASGQLTLMITTALNVLKSLGSSLVSVGSILSGVFTAGGSDAIAGMAFGLQQIALAVNSPAFQTTLGTIFAGAAQGASGLGAALAPIGTMLSAMAPLLSAILARSGVVLGQLLGGIATALAQPAFQQGLGAFFSGILSGILALLPALPALASALGTVGGFIGQLATVLGPTLATILTQLAPIFSDLLTNIEPLLPALGEQLVSAVTTLLPLLTQMISDGSLTTFVSLLIQLLPVVTQLALLLGSNLTTALAGLQEGFIIVSGVAKIVSALLSGDLPAAGQAASAMFSGLASTVSGSFKAIGPIVLGVINGIIDIVNGAIGAINGISGALKSVTGVSITLPRLSHVTGIKLATGGDVLATPGGVSTILGEGGRPERVIDQGLGNKGLAATIALAQRVLSMSQGGGGVNVTIPITQQPGESPRLLARMVGQEFRESIAGDAN